MAFTLAGTSYFKFGWDYGGWYWLLAGYALLELVALWIEYRSRNDDARSDANDNEFGVDA
jgi:hypothetical protein